MPDDLDRCLSEAREALVEPDPGASERVLSAIRASTVGRAAEGFPQPARRPRSRFTRRRGLLALAGTVVVAGAAAAAVSSFGGGPAAPVACTVLRERGTDDQLRYAFYGPDVALDSSGRALVAWLAASRSVQASSRSSSGDWTKPVNVSGTLDRRGRPNGVDVVMADDGSGLVAWSGYTTQVVSWSGSRWSAPSLLAQPGHRSDFTSVPRIAVNVRGQALALFDAPRIVTYGSGGYGGIGDPFPVLARRDADGWHVVAALTGPARVKPVFGRPGQWKRLSRPRLALDAAGRLVIVGGTEGVEATTGSLDGRFAPLQKLDSSTNPGEMGLAGDDAGGAVAAWTRGTNLVAANLDAGGRWTTRIVATPGFYGDIDFHLSVNAHGDAVIAYRAKARGVHGPRFPARNPTERADRLIQAVTYSATTGTWSRPTTLSSPGRPVNDPRTGIDSEGDALVVWVDGPNNGQEPSRLVSSEGTPGGAWKAAADVTPAVSDPIAPALAVAADGTAVAAWTGCRGDAAAVQVADRVGGSWGEPREISR